MQGLTNPLAVNDGISTARPLWFRVQPGPTSKWTQHLGQTSPTRDFRLTLQSHSDAEHFMGDVAQDRLEDSGQRRYGLCFSAYPESRQHR